MTEPMLRFVSRSQQAPEKRAADARRRDFREIYEGFQTEAAEAQAARCSQCGVPFCASGCPLSNDIPDWLFLAANNRLEEAYGLSSATNSFPEICGRICPQDRLCEGSCVIRKDFGSVTIGAVERFITENAFQEGWVRPEHPARALTTSVGIVGAGPAGLACAERLRAEGHEVHVYDRNPQPGGLLMYGIPGFKLEKHVVTRRWKLLEAQGVQFHQGVTVGGNLEGCPFEEEQLEGDILASAPSEGLNNVSLQELREKHDAVFLATGVYQARPMAGPGETVMAGSDLEGVVPALDYLCAIHGPDPLPSERLPSAKRAVLSASGRRVVVIGGGDTAMDCARTALREGAESVTVVYRRDRDNMPGSRQEVRNAEEEGARFHWLAAPEALLGETRVTGVRVTEMRLAAPDSDGRRAVVSSGASSTLEADMVICALGFLPEDLPTRLGASDLAVTRWGTLKVSRNGFETSLPGVFAGGDIVRGASLVVWAIRDGRDAARAIHAALLKKTQKQSARTAA